MPRFALGLLLLFAWLAPARAQGLVGFWRVEGTLPDGQAQRGYAAIGPGKTDGSLRILGRTRIAGELVVWKAQGRREGSRVEVRHLSGLKERLVGRKKRAPAVVGSYAIRAGEESFAGRLRIDGSAQAGTVVYTRVPETSIRFAPDPLVVEQGARRSTRVECEPPAVLAFLSIAGDPDGPASWEVDRTGLAFTSKTLGNHTVKLRLGPVGAPVTAELNVEVVPRLLDAVFRRVGELKRAGKTPLVVLGLEDTVFDTRPRTRAILEDFAHRHGEPRLKDLRIPQIAGTLRETLRNAGLSADELEGELGLAVQRDWAERFPRAESYAHDRARPGVGAFVNRLLRAGAQVVFVSARDASSRVESEEQLLEAALPGEPLLLARRGERAAAPALKLRLLREHLAEGGRLAALYDDDPAVANAYRKAFPEALTVWLAARPLGQDQTLVEGVYTGFGFK